MKRNNNNLNNLNSIFKNKNNNNKKNNNTNTNKNIIKREEMKIYKEITDNELNSLSYSDALIRDKRNFSKIYLSLIKTRQILFFTFKCKNDYNSIAMKFCFFTFMFAFSFFINTLFIDENALHLIFIAGGNLGIISTIPMMIYTVLITSIVKNFLLEIMFTEDNILDIKGANKQEKENIIQKSILKISLKTTIYFFILIFITSFIWFYFGCFFIVFKKTQFFALKNTLISFAISLAAPFIYYIIPACLRSASLHKRKKKNRIFLYMFSKIMQIIL